MDELIDVELHDRRDTRCPECKSFDVSSVPKMLGQGPFESSWTCNNCGNQFEVDARNAKHNRTFIVDNRRWDGSKIR